MRSLLLVALSPALAAAGSRSYAPPVAPLTPSAPMTAIPALPALPARIPQLPAARLPSAQSPLAHVPAAAQAPLSPEAESARAAERFDALAAKPAEPLVPAPPGRVERVVESGGRTYAATMDGLFARDGAEWRRLREGSTSDARAYGGRLYVAAWDGLFSAPLEGGAFRREPVERYYFPQSRIFEANGTLYVQGLSGVRKLENGRWKTNWVRRWSTPQRLFMKGETLYAIVGDRLLRADPAKWEPVFWNGGTPKDIAVIGGVKHVASDTGLWVRERSGWKRAVRLPMKELFERDGRWFARTDPELASGLYELTPSGWVLAGR